MRRGLHYLWFYYRLNFRVEYYTPTVSFTFGTFVRWVHPISNVAVAGGSAFARTLLSSYSAKRTCFYQQINPKEQIPNKRTLREQHLTTKMSQNASKHRVDVCAVIRKELLHVFSRNACFTFRIYTSAFSEIRAEVERINGAWESHILSQTSSPPPMIYNHKNIWIFHSVLLACIANSFLLLFFSLFCAGTEIQTTVRFREIDLNLVPFKNWT